MKKILLNSKLIIILLVIMNLAFANTLLAKSTTWNKTTGGAWGTAGNWTNGVPVAGDDVIINSNQSADITGVPTISLLSLAISGNCDFEGSASGNTVTVTGTFTVASGSTFSLGNGGSRVNFTLSGTGTINGTVSVVSGGTDRIFTNNGNLTISSTGVINEGTGNSSDFIMGAAATLQIGSTAGISSTGASGNIQVSGVITLPATANYTYNGGANQNTGTGLPTNLTGVLTINDVGFTVTLNSAKTIANTGSVVVTAGTFATGTNLTMASTSAITVDGGSVTGTFQGAGVYDVTYTGNSKTAGIELVNGGLRNVTVSLTAGQTLTLNANRAPDGNLSVTSGTLDLSTFTINRSAAGGTLAVSDGATLKIGGTNPFPTNYSTHTLGTTSSTVEYSGTAQTVSTESYANLTVSGSGNKTLAASTTVAATLTLNGGFLVIPTSMVCTVSSGNAIGGSGFGAAKHIVTQVSGATQGFIDVLNITSASTYTFPVGNGTSYLPATLTPTGATAGNDFRVSTFTGMTANGLPNGTPTNKANVVDAVWTVNNDNGATTSAVSMTLGWPAALEGATFAGLSNALIGISHYGGGVWGDYQQTSGDNTANVVTLDGITTFSPFSVGKLGPSAGTLPIKIYYFNASKGSVANTLNWSAECGSSQATFEIERSADGRNFTTINSITASQARCALPFSYDDASPLAGTNFYRIKMIDLEGRVSYTTIVKVGSQQKDIQLVAVLPNPVSKTAQLSIATTKKDNVELSVVSLDGRVMYKQSVQVQSGSSIVNLDVANLAPGAYFIKGIFGDGQTNSIKFIKQ